MSSCGKKPQNLGVLQYFLMPHRFLQESSHSSGMGPEFGEIEENPQEWNQNPPEWDRNPLE